MLTGFYKGPIPQKNNTANRSNRKTQPSAASSAEGCKPNYELFTVPAF